MSLPTQTILCSYENQNATAPICFYELPQPPTVVSPTQFKSWPHLVAAKQMEGLMLRETVAFLILRDST